jgi:hypothetical protein
MTTYSVGDRRRHLLMMSAVLALYTAVSPYQARADGPTPPVDEPKPNCITYSPSPGGPVCHATPPCVCGHIKPSHIGQVPSDAGVDTSGALTGATH